MGKPEIGENWACEKLLYLRLDEHTPFPELPELRPFRAVVIVDVQVTPERQGVISRWLVDAGCLYMMAWGIDCSSWDDSVDWAKLEKFDYSEIPDDQFVMTTWHENEPLDEVLWFAKHTARHSDVELPNLLLLHVGLQDREAELLKGYAQV